MSLPRPTGNEVLTQPYQRARGLGRSQWFMGGLFTWLARGADTGGLFALADIQARAGTEPIPHTHAHEDEAVVVVEGDVTYRSGAEVMRARSGEFVFLPRGLEHGFTLNSPEAHLLVLVTPAGLEATFDEFSEPAPALTLPPPPQGPPPPEFLAEVAARLAAAGVRLAPPPATPAR
jgi:quercetin dioxygenase-like cupin family protein